MQQKRLFLCQLGPNTLQRQGTVRRQLDKPAAIFTELSDSLHSTSKYALLSEDDDIDTLEPWIEMVLSSLSQHEDE
jgi:hypothetical protein